MSTNRPVIIVCASLYGGCGHFSNGSDFASEDDGDTLICPVCHEDYAFAVTMDNILRLVDPDDQTTVFEMMAMPS
jgi:hypothetical protein